MQWLPTMPDGLLRVVMAAYGAAQLATLLWMLPSARRFLIGEQWGGYADSSRLSRLLHRPAIMPVIVVVWLSSAVVLMVGAYRDMTSAVVLAAVAVNAALCRYFFLDMRWRSLLRGMGAPGFMSYWLSVCVLLLVVARRFAPSAFPVVVWAAQVDIALIMLSAGLYKLASGYARGEGMQYGMTNPQWCYWWRRYQRWPAGHWFFRLNNQLAWSVEVLAAVLMLIPMTRLWGGMLMALSFVYIVTQIRLGWLAEMVIIACLVFAGDLPYWASVPSTTAGVAEVPVVAAILKTGAWGYAALLPLIHAGLWWNLLRRRPLPVPAQRLLDAAANGLGVIIWRVFSADHTRFYVRISRRGSGEMASPEVIGAWDRWGDVRFRHVGEAIAVTCIFTALRYYPSAPEVFRTRLLRYARTLMCGAGSTLVFDMMSLWPGPDGFAMECARRFEVAPERAEVVEVPLSDRARRPGRVPAVREIIIESARPGSYAPRQPVHS